MDTFWKPHVTVAAVIEKDGRFLFVEEKSGNQVVINQPAGHLERGETFIEAVVREVFEETAWHFKPSTITGIYLWNNPNKDKTFLRVCFTGDCLEHDASQPIDDEIIQSLWLTPDELQQHQPHRSPMVMQCLKDYLAGQRFSLDILTSL